MSNERNIPKDKQVCTCTETCQRRGKPFPTDWSWQCQGLPYIPTELDMREREQAIHSSSNDCLSDTPTVTEPRRMNLEEAIKWAMEGETRLIDAEVKLCIWETERIVKQARANPKWETCFHRCLWDLHEAWAKSGRDFAKSVPVPVAWMNRVGLVSSTKQGGYDIPLFPSTAPEPPQPGAKAIDDAIERLRFTRDQGGGYYELATDCIALIERLSAGLSKIGSLSMSFEPVVRRLLAGESIEQIAGTPSETPAPQDEGFQARVHDWMAKCFMRPDSMLPVQRSFRFIEEALELVQASGTSREEVLRLVEYVYGRPPGVIAQEIGGVMVTLSGLATSFGLSMEYAGNAELARCDENTEKIRAKDLAKPQRSPLPGPSPLKAAAVPEPITCQLCYGQGGKHQYGCALNGYGEQT